jgi:hypothetical protein
VDNPVPGAGGDPRHRWVTPFPLVVTAWVAAAGALAWCLAGPDDPAGRLLIGVTALALACAAGYGTRVRPRLAAGVDGLWIGGVRGRTGYPWTAVQRLDVVHTRRFGRDVPTLEVETVGPGDAGERLHVFSRLELGADPVDVAETLAALRTP